MKIFPGFYSTVVLCLVLLRPASAQQQAAAKWGPGCNKALLDGEFSLAKAPEIACTPEKKAFIDKIIADVKGSAGSSMVGGRIRTSTHRSSQPFS